MADFFVENVVRNLVEAGTPSSESIEHCTDSAQKFWAATCVKGKPHLLLEIGIRGRICDHPAAMSMNRRWSSAPSTILSTTLSEALRK
jgi:hypothetical protein